MYAPLARREEEIEIEIADEHVLDHAARQPSESESETGTKAKGGLCCVVLCCVVLLRYSRYRYSMFILSFIDLDPTLRLRLRLGPSTGTGT